MKAVVWVGGTRRGVRAFPRDARKKAGYELRRVQEGLDPVDWRPLNPVGPGVREIRIHTGLEHRVIYVAKFEEGIYVFHAFEKKTRKTSREDIALARVRFREVLREHDEATQRKE